MTNDPYTCIYFDQSDQAIPLPAFQNWICSQPLFILIQNPVQLANQLLGVELIEPSEAHS